MKYLKYALGIIAILLLLFLAIGLIKPKASYESEVIVNKPLEETWMVLQDTDKLKEWLTGLDKIEHVSGTPGTVGAVSNVHFVSDGEQMIIKETITDLKPNETISMKYESDFMDMDYKIILSAANGTTKIQTYTTAEGNSMFSKSIMALIGGSMVKQEETNLAKLKKTIEDNSKDYFQKGEE